jgi:ribosomal-protein-alanine N-acetyltransferase
MTPTLETPRLILRPIELADADAMQILFPHWEVVRYLHARRFPWPYPHDGALTFLRDSQLPSMERGEAWAWSLRLKSKPDQLIGLISLQSVNPDGEKDNRGFWLGLPWHGQGLMTEACDAVTDYWFEVLGFPVLRVPKAAINLASRRISEKQGMRIVGTRQSDFLAGTLLSEIWEITAEEWRARRRATRP